ncbi:uncharacterized protein [Temnothorax longispinosus]|uniref:uncharacterized protein n=1 Tax=Temnothorax longispinosus TaxID=300112 RepID=UPI003A99CED4
MLDFGIPPKLVRLTRSTMLNTKCRVKVEVRRVRGASRIETGGWIGMLFNLILEHVVGYADDLNILGRLVAAVREAFQDLEAAARDIGLRVNESKTKVMVQSKRRRDRMGQNITMADHNFKVVNDFAYLGSNVNSENDETREIQKRITVGNRTLDADYAGDVDIRQSTTGWVCLLNAGPIAWGSKKQTVTATSTTEAEFMALFTTVKEVIWLRKLLKDLQCVQSNPTVVYLMEWDQEICIQLINEYKNKEVLWNPRDSAYYNKIKKEDAWRELAEKTGKSSEEVKKKIESLKGSYRREKTRVKTSMGTGKGRHEIYKSKWFAYESLQFLEDKDEPRRTISNLQTVSDNEGTSNETFDENEERELERSQIIEDSINSQTLATEQLTDETHCQNKEFKSPKKHPAKKRKTDEDPIITEALGYLRQTTAVSQQRKDQCSLFGDYIADKLRTFNNRLRAIAQNRISNILFELEMNLYTNPDTHTSMHFTSPSDLSHFQQTNRSSTLQNSDNQRPSTPSTPVSFINSPYPSPQENKSNCFQYFSDSTNDSQRT